MLNLTFPQTVAVKYGNTWSMIHFCESRIAIYHHEYRVNRGNDLVSISFTLVQQWAHQNTRTRLGSTVWDEICENGNYDDSGIRSDDAFNGKSGSAGGGNDHDTAHKVRQIFISGTNGRRLMQNANYGLRSKQGMNQ